MLDLDKTFKNDILIIESVNLDKREYGKYFRLSFKKLSFFL